MKRYITRFVCLYLRLSYHNYRHSPCFIITIKLLSPFSALSSPSYSICLLVTLLSRYILLHHFPPMPHGSMITTWSPQVSRAPLLKLWKTVSQQLTTSPLYPLRYPANGIFWRIFDKKVYMIHIHRHVYNLNIELFTGFPNDFLCRFRYFTFQYLPAILRRKKLFWCFSTRKYGLYRSIRKMTKKSRRS